MKSQSVIGVLGLLVIFLLLPSAFATEDRAFTESVVIFNTICAKCHEAQCSGRLSFDDAFEASSSHILRHYGEASGKQWLQKELFDILNYMKEKCAYYPMQTHVPLKKDWGKAILDRFSTLMEKNYFVPVGNFSPGSYRMKLELGRDTKVTVQLISEDFEMVVEDCFLSGNGKIDIPFSIEEKGYYYFRMYPREPVQILLLSISPIENDVHTPLPQK